MWIKGLFEQVQRTWKELGEKLHGKDELIQTKITIKTETLYKHLLPILTRNSLVDLVTGFCGIYTGASLIAGALDQSGEFNMRHFLLLFAGGILCLFSLYACCNVVFLM